MRRLIALVLVLSLPVHAAEESAGSKVLSGVLLGLSGALVAGGYTAGAILLGDDPGARALAISGGAVSMGMVGTSIGLAINGNANDPGSIVRYILTPILCGLAGAAIGGVAAGFGAWEPGAGRIATHATVVTLLVGVTIVGEIVR